MFIHTVLMAFAPGTDSSFHSKVEDFADRVRHECDGVANYLYGENEANRSNGFTHAVVACFDDEEAHNRYQASTVHQEMKTFMATRIEHLIVFDSANWG